LSWIHTHHAVRVIRRGGVLAYPTEAVYGLGCSPCYREAVCRILQLKKRPAGKGLILVGADISQFAGLVDIDRLENRDRVLASWPGPVTWIIPAKPGVPDWLTGDNTGLAVRISAHPLVRELCKKAGVLVSTSANPAGCRPARNPSRVRTYFGNQLDYVLPGPVGSLSGPTEIRDALTGQILRQTR